MISISQVSIHQEFLLSRWAAVVALEAARLQQTFLVLEELRDSGVDIGGSGGSGSDSGNVDVTNSGSIVTGTTHLEYLLNRWAEVVEQAEAL